MVVGHEGEEGAQVGGDVLWKKLSGPICGLGSDIFDREKGWIEACRCMCKSRDGSMSGWMMRPAGEESQEIWT